MSTNSRTCGCTTQQYDQIIFNSVAYQNSANVVYQGKNALVAASTNGTLGKQATGNPTFKSNYERMQYLLGQQNQASCGVPGKTFALGTN
uniref:Uncharacterized protein n=1 Tax=viral metagenome TaxID=1070528 RepID=A0A6C0AMK4_9ZZZZ